jgi:hypothetical protein
VENSLRNDLPPWLRDGTPPDIGMKIEGDKILVPKIISEYLYFAHKNNKLYPSE